MKKKPSLGMIKQQIDSLVVDPATKLGLRVGFLSLGLQVLILGAMFNRLPPEVPLLYSQPYGESQLVSSWGLGLLPGFSLLIQLVSIKSAENFIETDKLLAQILSWVGGLTSLMALITLVKIMFLVM